MNELPIGISDFTVIRRENLQYVDKSKYAAKLIKDGRRYFLSRPKGYGKTLLLSTLAAMFRGKAELFKALEAEDWVKECEKNPYPVMTFDFSSLNTEHVERFQANFEEIIEDIAECFSVETKQTLFEIKVLHLFKKVYNKYGPIVLLIDEYDKPITKIFKSTKKLFEIYKILQLFYEIIKSHNHFFRFIMITGEEKYNKTGVYSTISSLDDITETDIAKSITEFSPAELEEYFIDWIEYAATSTTISPSDSISAQKTIDVRQVMSTVATQVVSQAATHAASNTLKQNLTQTLTQTLKQTLTHTATHDPDKQKPFYHPLSIIHCLKAKKLEEYARYLQVNMSRSPVAYACINQGDTSFLEAKNFKIYVDKSELLIHTNNFLESEHKYICVSRPRRFGKTISLNMIAAYYDIHCDATTTFKGLKITNNPDFTQYSNKYITVCVNIQTYLSKTHDIDFLLEKLKDDIIKDLAKQYGYEYLSEDPTEDVADNLTEDLNRLMNSISKGTGLKFVLLIDEWDCILREYKEKEDWQKKYLDFLRYWFKDQEHLALVYMTGILPIKKYGTHSALNMFDEYSMLTAKPFTEFVGFTEEEVKELCARYTRDFQECKKWYDGYQIDSIQSIYNPRSVNCAIYFDEFTTYWNKTETYEALQIYITLKNFNLHETVTKLLANDDVPVDTTTFTNDMKTFHSTDDVLTLLVHLGYLSYNAQTSTVRIPNKEIACEFVNAIKNGGWPLVVAAIQASDKLLQAVLEGDAETVARGVEAAHLETSILQYNDENALSYTVSLAFYAARERYTVVREFPTGKGFADLVFLPRNNHVDPILVIELKWDKSAESAIQQIKEKKYPDSLIGKTGSIRLVGITYDKVSKKHSCCIESIQQ